MFFSSRIRHTICALVTGVQTCALPICRALVTAAATHCARAGAELLVNGEAALARDLGLGLHLPSAQLRELAERPVPAGVPLAASCHDETELRHAEAIGCDFAIIGPVKPTTTHPPPPCPGRPTSTHTRDNTSPPTYSLHHSTPPHQHTPTPHDQKNTST